MDLSAKPKRYRYPVSIISFAVWRYHRLIMYPILGHLPKQTRSTQNE